MAKSFLYILFISLLYTFTTADVFSDFQNCFTQNNITNSQIFYSPTNSNFQTVLQTYIRNRRFNTSTTPRPVLIITPTVEIHVSTAVICSKQLGVQLKIRSGGHDYDGISYVSNNTFVILDMFNFRSINISIAENSAWVGSGAMLGELYYRIWQQSGVHGFPAGICPTVGVGGHLSGGGYGNMLRKYGLTVDHVTDARMVDANGRVLNRASMGEDLFWAINGGGGGSFGVVLGYKINLVPVPEIVTIFRVERFMNQNATNIVFQYQQVMQTIDNDLFIRILLQPITRNRTRSTRATFIGQFLGNSTQLLTIIGQQFPSLGLQRSDLREMSWINSVLFWGNFDNTTAPEVLLNRTPDSVNFLKRKSDYVQTPIPLAGIEALFNQLVEIGRVGLVFNSYGGRNSEIPADASPFPHRGGNLYKIQYSINWSDDNATLDAINMGQIRALYDFMEPYVSRNPRGAFLNYRDLDIGTTDNGRNSYAQGRVYGQKYFLGNFDRLVRIKSVVDPENVFRNEQSIPLHSFRGRRTRQ